MRHWRVQEAIDHLRGTNRSNDGDNYRWFRGSVTIATARLPQAVSASRLRMMAEGERIETLFSHMNLLQVSELRNTGSAVQSEKLKSEDANDDAPDGVLLLAVAATEEVLGDVQESTRAEAGDIIQFGGGDGFSGAGSSDELDAKEDDHEEASFEPVDVDQDEE